MSRSISRGFGTSGRTAFVVALAASLIFPTCLPCQTKAESKSSQDFPEMLLTQQGMLAIDSPNGWVRADGPGLAYFVPKAGTTAANNVFIYISSAPIGPTEDTKNLKEYVESDIAGFKHRFKSGVITEETPIDLPFAKSKAPAYTFCSAEVNNAFEKIVYIAEKNRVLILALSAKKKDAFDESQSVFRQFVQSYRGSLAETAPGR